VPQDELSIAERNSQVLEQCRGRIPQTMYLDDPQPMASQMPRNERARFRGSISRPVRVVNTRPVSRRTPELLRQLPSTRQCLASADAPISVSVKVALVILGGYGAALHLRAARLPPGRLPLPRPDCLAGGVTTGSRLG
jgi:hypothetical protein